MTLKLKIQEFYMALVKRFLENMCALSVSLHFLRALSLESESAHKKCKDTERESTHFYFSLYMYIFGLILY